MSRSVRLHQLKSYGPKAPVENRICSICDQSFEAYARGDQKYCSEHCRRIAEKNKYRRANPKVTLNGVTLSTGTKGALAELKVAINLIERGYEVFRAVSPASPCDFAILKNNKMLRLEVKSRHYSPAGNEFKLPPHQADILALVHPDNKITYYPEIDSLMK